MPKSPEQRGSPGRAGPTSPPRASTDQQGRPLRQDAGGKPPWELSTGVDFCRPAHAREHAFFLSTALAVSYRRTASVGNPTVFGRGSTCWRWVLHAVLLVALHRHNQTTHSTCKWREGHGMFWWEATRVAGTCLESRPWPNPRTSGSKSPHDGGRYSDGAAAVSSGHVEIIYSGRQADKHTPTSRDPRMRMGRRPP